MSAPDEPRQGASPQQSAPSDGPPVEAPGLDDTTLPQADAVRSQAEPSPPLGEAFRSFSSALRREGTARARVAGAGLASGAGRAWSGLAAGAASAAARTRDALARARAARAARAAASPGKAAPSDPAAYRPSRLRRFAVGVRRSWRLLLALLAGLALGGLAAVVAVWLVMRDLPLSNILPPLAEPSLSIKTADGETLTSQGAYRAAYVPLDGFPAMLPEAVMALEDRRFREHHGVDWRGMARALSRNIAAGGVVEGGSTLTQQLVKILYLEPDRTITRKLQEVALATTLERQLGKDRILELYLNSVYLGSGAYGMPAAAETYFGKEVGDLTLPECALLAASIQAPSQVNPRADLGAVQNRAALDLKLMADQGRIDGPARDAALAQLAVLSPRPAPARAGSYFADWVLGEASDLAGESPAALTATATLDPRLQAQAETIVRDVLGREGAAAQAGQAALVAMTPTGEVRAMVGGLDYAESQFNRATDAKRQPGSTFKLFVYLAALASGATPDSRVEDAPVEIGGWNPENFDGRSHGTVSLREAFAHSYNLSAVRVAQAVGIDKVIAVARQFGVEGDLKATPSLALGTSEVSLLDMTEAYAAVALGRAPVKATGLTAIRFGDQGATLAVAGDGDVPQVELARTQAPMLDLLAAVVRDGTGHAAMTEGVLGGKTGTSQDSRDAWFIGFTQYLVVGVWVGNDDNTPMDRVTGGGLPAEIFRAVVEAAAGEPRAAAAAAEPAPVQCNLRACSRAYRSFRASDCTFQPYSGPRQICTR